MLELIRAENFKCLDGFELPLDGHALLLGGNGSGKSTVVELLDRLRRFWVAGEKATDCFSSLTRTRWKSEPRQALGLRLREGHRTLDLRVVFAAPDERGVIRVAEETITGPGVAVRRLADAAGQVEIDILGQAQQILVPDELSALPLLAHSMLFPLANAPAPPQTQLVRALDDVASVIPFQLEPTAMESLARAPSGVLQFDGRNFASWLLLQKQLGHLNAMTARATEALAGFKGFDFVQEGQRFRLWTEWASGVGTGDAVHRYEFTELSDGQRLLLVLSALVEVARRRPWRNSLTAEMTLVLDEPDNFVALPEIQPLLFSLLDTPGLQVIIASHHPEIINWMAPQYGFALGREHDGAVQVNRWRAPEGVALPAAELVARGDVHGGA